MHKLLLTILLSFLTTMLWAQEVCGTDDIHQRLLATDPKYRLSQKANNEQIKKYIAAKRSEGERSAATLYTIPVVIHVVHTGAAIGSTYNPTDAQLTGAIDYLNKIYNGTEPTLNGGIGDMQVQFVLAKRDTNCNATTGIERVDGSSIPGYSAAGVNFRNTNGADELSVKDYARWNPSDYYNIWVVNKIDGADGSTGQFFAGYAYFPGYSSAFDGIVILASQMKSGKKTLPHEFGHALNLFHTFQGSIEMTNCPSNIDCSTEGDLVCDTDPITYNSADGTTLDFTCRTGLNSCTGAAYGSNTESNFMSYTTCYTLFTAGQKERALAAMTLPDRQSLANSLGATSPFGGTQPCHPALNFEMGQLTISEITVDSFSCRKYKDYTLAMAVGSAPLGTTIATLQVGGTATNTSDYLLTTNGSFTSPSNELVFAAGSNSSQYFTLRIFDDVSIEPAETIIIDFTVSNGPGAAQKGVTYPTLTIKINDNDVAPLPFGVGTVTIGSGNYSNFYHPFRSAFQQARSQSLYLASELQAAGLSAGSIISKMAFQLTAKNSTMPYAGFTVGMKNTTVNALNKEIFETGITTVYSNTYTTTAGINTLTLSNPFVWDGISNLLVECCYNNAAASAFNDYVSSSLVTTPLCTWNRATTGEGCQLTPVYDNVANVGYIRPDITLSAQVGSPVATSLNAAQTIYLGPYADIYFRSDNKVIARIKNLSAVDYGCTTVTIDRAGSGTVPFWNNNTNNYLAGKTLKVTPANNDPSGQYEISLYYTQAEVFGWETGTGQNFTGIQLIKTNGPVSSVTPLAPTASAPVMIAMPTNTAFGNDRVITGSFQNGLAGFGAGIIAITTYTFTGTGNWDLAANWTNNSIPPTTLPDGSRIIIDPIAGGECILNTLQTISQASIFEIKPGKQLRILGGLEIK